MQVIVIRPNPSRRDDLVAELWEHGTVGILEDACELRAYFPEGFGISRIVTPENGEVLQCLSEEGTPNYPASDANCEPVFLGQKFVVLPDSCAHPISSARIPLSVAASPAFGSGRHESTQLMVEAMESYVQPGKVIIDVGCGSGILSQAARYLGASTIIACDIHTDAIATARRTCTAAAAFIGSVDATASSTADLVLANISAKVIDALAADLVRVTKCDGCLLLSGFIHDRTPKRFKPEKVLERNGWQCWICRPELVPAGFSEASHVVQPFEEQWW